MKIISNVVLFICVVIIGSAFPKDNDPVVKKVFFENCSVLKDRFGSFQKSELQKLVTEHDDVACLVANLKYCGSRNDREFYSSLVIDGCYYIEFMNNFRSFVEDTAIAKIILSGIGSASPAVFRTINLIYLDKIRPDFFKLFSDDIKRYLKLSDFAKFTDTLRIMYRVKLTDKERGAILARIDKDDICTRALFGDSMCIDSVISIFRNADQYNVKASYAAKLGHIGTDKCAKALLESLVSNLQTDDEKSVISIRTAIIEALGRIHPENSLLTTEIQKIKRFNDAAYASGLDSVYQIRDADERKNKLLVYECMDSSMTIKQKEKIRSYLNSIVKWGKELYGTSVVVNEHYPFLHCTYKCDPLK